MSGIRRFTVLVLFGVLLAHTLLRVGHASEPHLDADQANTFVDFFDTLALTADYGPFNNRPAWIRKWNRPVTVILVGRAEALRKDVQVLAGRISGWTGLAFSVAPRGTPPRTSGPNVITVRMISADELPDHFSDRDIVCQTETHGLGGELHTGFIVVSDRYADCLKHEFMHAIGFDSHWRAKNAGDIRSVLAYRDSVGRAEDYSEWDIMAIRLLYNWRIQAGMARSTSLLIARELVAGRPQRAAVTPQRINQRMPW